ncbi:MAG: hypothetical protein K2K29_05840, partial [Muribaculaceae bacterium]|nr:hypothetical protein [Muribaculaceae bacterium]
ATAKCGFRQYLSLSYANIQLFFSISKYSLKIFQKLFRNITLFILFPILLIILHQCTSLSAFFIFTESNSSFGTIPA